MSSESVKQFIKPFGEFFKIYGGQVMITSAGVSMTAFFAGHNNILPPLIAWLMAIGFEVQWIRGLMQAGQTKSPWVGAMVAAGFTSIVTFGVLACLIKYEVIPEKPDAWVGVILAIAHVLPIAFMALCSAMIHRDAEQETAERNRIEKASKDAEEKEQRAAQQALALQKQEKEQELELWEKAQRIKQSLKGSTAMARPAAYPLPQKVYECPQCGSEMTATEYGNYKSAQSRNVRWRGCKACRERA